MLSLACPTEIKKKLASLVPGHAPWTRQTLRAVHRIPKRAHQNERPRSTLKRVGICVVFHLARRTTAPKIPTLTKAEKLFDQAGCKWDNLPVPNRFHLATNRYQEFSPSNPAQDAESRSRIWRTGQQSSLLIHGHARGKQNGHRLQYFSYRSIAVIKQSVTL